jgi:7,8-dihydropterin-6-yl-methyl-4-(beta-D-ribofuranosyl)aminobenzene 5'-phosphate synthase
LDSVRRLKATTLADNLTFHGSLLGQWGLSILLEIESTDGQEHTILLDTGAEKEALIFNINRLKLSLRNLEAIVLSHGHPDHTAATVELARRSRRKVQVIAHPHTFKRRYTVTKKAKRVLSQVPKGEREKDLQRVGARLRFTKEPCQIIPGVVTTGEIPRQTSFEKISGKRIIQLGRQSQRDYLLDDQAIIVNVHDQGAWVFSGCAHSGIINTLRRAESLAQRVPIHAIIGGMHLVSKTKEEIEPIVNALKQYTPKLISPCHCTGFRATSMIHEAFERQFILNFSGRTISSWKTTLPSII